MYIDCENQKNYCFISVLLNPHCLLFDFTTPEGENSQLRARAIPQTINHYGTRKIEKYFRIDLTAEASNKANCKGDDIFPGSLLPMKPPGRRNKHHTQRDYSQGLNSQRSRFV